jgi:lysophospholipase L1-like esterase
MKTYLKKSLLLVITAIAVVACGADISGSLDEDGDPGRADFSTFIAIGDSFTAGYADGALYRQIQESSLASILAQQFALTGANGARARDFEFTQPLMPEKATGSLTMLGVDLGRPDRLMLGATGDPDSPAAPETIKPTKTTEIMTRVAGAGTFNNFGVPGAKSFHLGVGGYGNLSLPAFVGGTSNPYFARFASSNAASMLGDAAALVPTFFTLWMGNNDILLYALDGGATQNAVPPYGTASTDVTAPAMFTAAYNGAVAALTAAPGTQGLLINIPDVAVIPHFTTVPYNPIPMSAADAAAANAAYVPYNLGLNAALGFITQAEIDRRTIKFERSDTNPMVITDESLTTVPGLPSIRHATKKDLILLPVSPKIGEEATPGDPTTIWGVGTALLDGDVLTKFEYGQVETARKAYNKTIKAAADANKDLLFFDVAAMFDELNKNGISYGSGGVSSTFAQGGAFSLDGVHPTARGYAVIANEIFKVINKGFDAYIPPVDPSEYTTVFYQ